MTYFIPSIIHQKVKKWQRFLVAGKIPGRSLRGGRPESPVPGFSCPSPLVWCLSGASPEYHRRVPGVSGRPEYLVTVTGVSGMSKRHRQVSARARSLRHAPESPVLLTGVSGPRRSVHRVVPPLCLSEDSPEGVRSLRVYTGVSGDSGRSLRPKWLPTVRNRGGV